MNGKDIAVVAVFCTAIVGMLLRPLFVAWARRIGGGATSDVAHELDELRQRVADLEAERARLLELEDRVDFAERMLAQRDAAPQLAQRTPA